MTYKLKMLNKRKAGHEAEILNLTSLKIHNWERKSEWYSLSINLVAIENGSGGPIYQFKEIQHQQIVFEAKKYEYPPCHLWLISAGKSVLATTGMVDVNPEIW